MECSRINNSLNGENRCKEKKEVVNIYPLTNQKRGARSFSTDKNDSCLPVFISSIAE
jgi:hypothetical protein